MVRVINVGLGVRGRRWVEWAKDAGADVVGLVDANPDTLSEQGEALGFPEDKRFTSVAEAVKALQPQAAVVCAPNHVHPILARECLEQGLHLLIEKPMAEDIETAKGIVELAEDRGLQFTVAQQYRYRKPEQALKKLLEMNAIGDLTGGMVQFYRWRPTKGMALPILLNQAIHHFDTMRAVIGSTPVSCMADLWNPDWNDCDGPTVVEATFRWENGARIHYSGSYVARGKVTSFDALWRLEGSKGQIIYDGEHEIRVHQGDDGATTVEQHPYTDRDAVLSLTREFLTAVETGKPTPTNGRDNLDTLAMAFAIDLSSKLRREVTIAEVLEGAYQETGVS